VKIIFFHLTFVHKRPKTHVRNEENRKESK
jgi:hypothetical protein